VSSSTPPATRTRPLSGTTSDASRQDPLQASATPYAGPPGGPRPSSGEELCEVTPCLLPRLNVPAVRVSRHGPNSAPQSPARKSITAGAPGRSQAGPNARGRVTVRRPTLVIVTCLAITS